MSTESSRQVPPDGGARLAPPPRVVSPDLARYLTLIYSQIPLALLGFGMIAFWGNCGFGADYRSLLFLMPVRQTVGHVTRFEPTGAQEWLGAAPLGPRDSFGKGDNAAVEAIYFSYRTPDGKRRSGICYTRGGGTPTAPVAEDHPTTTLNPGTAVSVEYVTARPEAARIQGTRTGIYGLHMLIVLVFPGVGLLMLIRGRRFLRRLMPLLASGREDPPGSLRAPEDAGMSIALTAFPFSRLSIRDGQLRAPVGYIPKLCFTPLLALVCNVWFIWANSTAIFYPIKVLLGHGR